MIAATLMALMTPMTTASADQGDTFTGGCGFDTALQAYLTNGSDIGNVYGTGVTQEANGTPSSATVSCWITVNGVEQPGTRLTFRIPGDGYQQVSFSANSTDRVRECLVVWFDDGSLWSGAHGTNPDCEDATASDISGIRILRGLVVEGINAK